MEIVIAVVVGFVGGVVVTWLYARKAIAKVQSVLDQVSKQ